MNRPDIQYASAAAALPLFALALALAATAAIPAADAQAGYRDGVVINEVETNPPGSDAASVSEWVELYNPTGSAVDLGGWTIASTTVAGRAMTIPDGTSIMPGQFLTYSYERLWFTNAGESVRLSDGAGALVDRTPRLYDTRDDASTWQRTYDGYGPVSGDLSDWKFAKSTAGLSNGKPVQSQGPGGSDPVAITVAPDRQSYAFGETAVIGGSVSERIPVQAPYFDRSVITMEISGPGFARTLTLYPDSGLGYGAAINLSPVLGIAAGSYDVAVRYGAATDSSSFTVGTGGAGAPGGGAGGGGGAPALQVSTDRERYLPGSTASITGSVSETAFLEGVAFNVTDPAGAVIAAGSLFPTGGAFATDVFLTNVSPVLGTYAVEARYAGASASATFELVEDIREDAPISLSTGRAAYGLGDLVTINGRLNHVWVNTLDLEITQTRQTSISAGLPYGSDAGFKIRDGIRVAGDGSFAYSFVIPDGAARLGDYRIQVSEDLGSAAVVISAVADPGAFVASDRSITVQTDRASYDLGQEMTVTGSIGVAPSDSTYKAGRDVVGISVYGTGGGAAAGAGAGAGGAAYTFTAIPEASGRYEATIGIANAVFAAGSYTVRAEHGGGSATAGFEVVDPLVGSGGAAVIWLDREVYGLGQTVRLEGILPPAATGAVDIALTKPGGTIINSGAPIDNQRFSWSWDIPAAEKAATIKQADARTHAPSNFGVYKIKVYADERGQDLLFKVSPDPDNDSLPDSPILVSTEKSLYRAGERLHVVGDVIRIKQTDGGLVAPQRVTIKVFDGSFPFRQIHESAVYPDQGGGFSSYFELPATVFPEGSYTVKAYYGNARADTSFGVANDLVFGAEGPVRLLLSLDGEEYRPGDTVWLTGKPNKLIYLEEFDVSVIKKDDAGITCGAFHCGIHTGPVTSIRAGPTGSFAYQFAVPDSADAVGTYEITVDADFEARSVTFDVVGGPVDGEFGDGGGGGGADTAPPAPPPSTVIERENRITEEEITISVAQKAVGYGDGDSIVQVAPRVIAGSVITSAGGDPGVNLMVSHAATGTCVIGPAPGCLVGGSTRGPGQIYETVEVDGASLKVRYTGPDARLERFTILPESAAAFLPDSDWDVRVLKDGADQVSRFYYKVTYKAL